MNYIKCAVTCLLIYKALLGTTLLWAHVIPKKNLIYLKNNNYKVNKSYPTIPERWLYHCSYCLEFKVDSFTK